MKKRLLLLASTSFFIIAGNAQVKKGSIFLGGDIGGSSIKTEASGSAFNKRNVVFVSPVLGKAIKDNLVFGGSLDIGFFEDEYTSVYNSQKSNSYGVGFFLRKYKPLGNSGFFIFVQGSLNGSYSRDQQEDPNSSIKYAARRYGVSFSAYPGISYAVTKKLHLETGFNNLLNLGYWHEKRTSDTPTAVTYKSSGVSISSSLNNFSSLYLGFRVLLSK